MWFTQSPVFFYKYIDANARAGNEFRSYGKAVSGRVIKKSLKNSIKVLPPNQYLIPLFNFFKPRPIAGSVV